MRVTSARTTRVQAWNIGRWTKSYMIQLLPASPNTPWTTLPFVLQPHGSSFSSSNISSSLLYQGPLYVLALLLRTFVQTLCLDSRTSDLSSNITYSLRLSQKSLPKPKLVPAPNPPPPPPFPLIWSLLFPHTSYQMSSCLFVYLFSARHMPALECKPKSRSPSCLFTSVTTIPKTVNI